MKNEGFARAGVGLEKIKQQVRSDPGAKAPWGRLESRRVFGAQSVADLRVRRDQVLNKQIHLKGFMRALGDRGNESKEYYLSND
ncbi:hypothetical protein E1301_Tti010575 [Triplophysa tibetana]|uniref:Uncharacterized protein n=1 Tax=Triplophysa tibetana TaxID=1572043 RepID=A0A5A9PVR5_9TELE|nr:hypothetical protein E1301_Tti010575 [Triplophysa tibetana]